MDIHMLMAMDTYLTAIIAHTPIMADLTATMVVGMPMVDLMAITGVASTVVPELASALPSNASSTR